MNFMSHHPLHQKLGVIRTLLNRCDNVVTEEEDRRQGGTRHQYQYFEAMQLSSLEYPKSKKGHAEQERQRNKESQSEKELKSRGMVTIPYVKGLSEAFSRILKTYRICTAVRPHTTLRNMLVHPKDRINDEEKPEVVYKIPCKNCERVYVGETGRPLGVRIKEHRKEVDSITEIFTGAEKTRAAITRHVCNENHVIDWDKAKVNDRESDKSSRHRKEAI